MSEDENPEARIKAIIALTQVQTEATEVHERYSLLIMGFVGALAGYLFGPTKALLHLQGYEYWSAIFLVISLGCSLPAFWLGHMTALLRSGFQNSDQLEKTLQNLDQASRLDIIGAASRWFYDRVLRIDRFVGEPLMESDKPWPDRIEAVCGRMVALGFWQSFFMRLQLLFAVFATIALVLARL